MDTEIVKELFKLVSSLDHDWNGNDNVRNNLVRFLIKNQEHIADSYVEAAYGCVAQYDEVKLHLLRHQLINEILVEENKEKRKYFVYKHTVPNGKVYIGITCSKSVELRWFGGMGYSQNLAFYEDIKKYGWDNIIHEVLSTGLSKETAFRCETSLIAFYKSDNPLYGYNHSKGGEGKTGFSPSVETRQKIKNKLTGRQRPDEVKRKLSVAHFGKPLTAEHKEKNKDVL